MKVSEYQMLLGYHVFCGSCEDGEVSSKWPAVEGSERGSEVEHHVRLPRLGFSRISVFSPEGHIDLLFYGDGLRIHFLL